MDPSSESRWQAWRSRLRRIWATARRGLPFAGGMLAAFASIWIYNTWINPPAPPLTLRDVQQAAAQVMASATPAPAFSSRAWQVIQPSLVLIQTGVSAGDAGEAGTDSSLPADHPDVERALGSGVIISDAGEILTSLHVVDGASQITVTFFDGTEANALVAVAQPENDIAVLSVDTLPEVLIPATLGNPGAMQVGDEAYAAGNPFGLYGSFTAGVISGFDRSFRTTESENALEGLIQIDAAVNPGNSGGPLLNRYGQVIGIVVGILNPTDQDVFIGIGFAVPIDVAGGAAGLPPQ